MAKLNLTLPSGEIAVTGKQVTFVAPCDSEGLTHIIIDNEEFELVDSKGIALISGAFVKDAMVSVILHTDTYKAYIQNAANTPHNHSVKDISDFPQSMPASDVPAWAKEESKPSYSASEVGASPTGHKHTKSEITDFPTSMTPTSHNHTKSEITDFPTSMTPTSHNQNANTITAGTFAGIVKAGSSYQTYSTSLLRNSKLVSTETNPTVNGEINWTYK